MLTNLVLRIMALMQDQDGQALAEYGLILGVIAFAALASLSALGVAVTAKFDSVANVIS